MENTNLLTAEEILEMAEDYNLPEKDLIELKILRANIDISKCLKELDK